MSEENKRWILMTAMESIGAHVSGASAHIRFPALTTGERQRILQLYDSNALRLPVSLQQSCNMCWMNTALTLLLLPRSRGVAEYLKSVLMSAEDQDRECVDALFGYVLVMGFGSYLHPREVASRVSDEHMLTCARLAGRVHQDDVANGMEALMGRYGIQKADVLSVTRQMRIKFADPVPEVLLSSRSRSTSAPLTVVDARTTFEETLQHHERQEELGGTPLFLFQDAYSNPDVDVKHTMYICLEERELILKPALFLNAEYLNSPLLCWPVRQEIIFPCFFSSRPYTCVERKLFAEMLGTPLESHTVLDRSFAWESDVVLVCTNESMRRIRENARALKLMVKYWLRLLEELELYSDVFRESAAELLRSSKHISHIFDGYEKAEKAIQTSLPAILQRQILEKGVLKAHVVKFPVGRGGGKRGHQSKEDGDGALDFLGMRCYQSAAFKGEYYVLCTRLHEICAAARVFEFPARIACMHDRAADEAFMLTNATMRVFIGFLSDNSETFRTLGRLARDEASNMRIRLQDLIQNQEYRGVSQSLYDVGMVMRSIEDRLVNVTATNFSNDNEMLASRVIATTHLEARGKRGAAPGSMLYLQLSRKDPTQKVIFSGTRVKLGKSQDQQVEFEIVGAAIPTNKSKKNVAGHWYSLVKVNGEYLKIDSIDAYITKISPDSKFLSMIQNAPLLLLQVPYDDDDDAAKATTVTESDQVLIRRMADVFTTRA